MTYRFPQIAKQKRSSSVPKWTEQRGIEKIYLLWAENTTWFKIGYTRCSMSNRLSEIQVGCPLAIHFICAAYGGKANEKETHKVLSAYRIRGEWFNFGGHEDVFEAVLVSFGVKLNPEAIAAIPPAFAEYMALWEAA